MAVDLSYELSHTFLSQPNGVPIIVGISLWFFVGFLINRKRWWLLIPAYILIIAAIDTAIQTTITPAILYGEGKSTLLLAYSTGAGIMLMLALLFFVVYFLSNKYWWALIPAGSFTSIGLMILLQFIFSDKKNTYSGAFTGVLLLGLAATFGILWLRRKTQPTQWTIYPTVGLFVLSVLAFILGDGWNAISEQTKAIGFAAASAIFFIGYFVHGLSKWGWLFPALLCAAMTITIWMSINKMEDSPLMGLPIPVSVALPFYVGFALNHKHWGFLIPAIIVTIVTILMLISDTNLEGVGVMFVFALPFFVIYFLSKKNWWAFIPAGTFASFGLVSVLEILVPHEEYASLPGTLSWEVYIWVLFLGFAVTFGIPWLRRKSQPTDWTKYPALGFLALAIRSFTLGERFQEFWLDSAMLVTASMLLLATLINKVPAAGQQMPEIKA
jgi:hypothetical protein